MILFELGLIGFGIYVIYDMIKDIKETNKEIEKMKDEMNKW